MSRLTDAEREALASALHVNDVQSLEGIHSWRCSYPIQYGPCDCFEQVVNDVDAAVTDLLTNRLAQQREEIARAIEAEFVRWDSLGGPRAPHPLNSIPWFVERSYCDAARIAREATS